MIFKNLVVQAFETIRNRFLQKVLKKFHSSGPLIKNHRGSGLFFLAAEFCAGFAGKFHQELATPIFEHPVLLGSTN